MVELDPASLVIEPLEKSHIRGAFDCGVAKITNFLRNNARKQHEAYQVRVFVACDESKKVLGFYSLTLATFEPDHVSEEAQEKFDRVKSVPTIYSAMIGVDLSAQGQGVGYRMMIDAFERCLLISEHVGAYAIALHALDEATAEKYARYGYERFEDGELAMFLPLKTLRAARDA
jgi:GNAT superfamily N-acetyltransferase